MAERLDLRDAYLAVFDARIVERVLLPGGRLAVALDRTAFRPGLGGLPADRGWLNHVAVAELIVRAGDGEILHVLTEEIWETEVRAQLDWQRRLDVMRQHTAGHLLAQAFAQACGASVAGMIVDERQAYVDLHRLDLSAVPVEQAERAANELALSDRAVRVASVDAAQASQVGLAAPAGAQGRLQVVNVEGVGVTVCDGVHVARTGEVGLIKVLDCEPQGDRLRVRFVCGARALAEFRRADQALAQIAASLGAARPDVAPAAALLVSRLNATQAQVEAMQNKMAGFEAETMAACAQAAGGTRVVQRVYAEQERSVAELRRLAQLVTARPGFVALLGIAGAKAQLVFARSADVSHDMTMLVRGAAQVLNSQGGGQPALAESAPARAGEARVQAAIAKAVKLLQAQR